MGGCSTAKTVFARADRDGFPFCLFLCCCHLIAMFWRVLESPPPGRLMARKKPCAWLLRRTDVPTGGGVVRYPKDAMVSRNAGTLRSRNFVAFGCDERQAMLRVWWEDLTPLKPAMVLAVEIPVIL